MNTTTLSPRALSVIDQYMHFKFGSAVCSVPYFNNRTVRARAASAVNVGKGSPKQILEEIGIVAARHRIAPDALADEGLKKLMADNNIGIDCSGFAWHVLNAECEDRKMGALKRHLHFVQARGLFGFGKILTAINPVKNSGVLTFADDLNSRLVQVRDVAPGDFITMIGGQENGERNHLLVVHQVDASDPSTLKICYSHAFAYPEDGLYGSGIKQGAIEISDLSKSITDGVWSEGGSPQGAARIFDRALKSKTELRRFNWF